ncbi:Cell division protein FtsB, partial [Salmonella enterica subsp. enterica serovar Hvittingfoss str. A4-620]
IRNIRQMWYMRNELSMTKPGETFYRLVPDASKRAATAGQTHR